MVAASCSCLIASLLLAPPRAPHRASRIVSCDAFLEEERDNTNARKARRAQWFHENNPHKEERPLVLERPRYLSSPQDAQDAPHPLLVLLKETLADEGLHNNDRHLEGQRCFVQMVGTSPLGLNVVLVPSGVEGLIYADESGYAPDDGTGKAMMLGDVVPAYVVQARADLKLDLSFRPPGALPKLEAGAEAVLRAARAAGGTLALGDASSPESIRRELSISKSTFKAARGKLLRNRLVVHPLDDHETVLTEAGLAFEVEAKEKEDEEDKAPHGGGGGSSSATGCDVTLLGLPDGAARRCSGPSALLRLLSPYGTVRSLRGLVRQGEISGRVTAWMGSKEEAQKAVDALMPYERRGGPAARLGTVLYDDRVVRHEDEDERWREDYDDEEEYYYGAGAAGAAGGAAPAEEEEEMTSIFVGNLPYDATEDDLWDVFLDCGYISSVWLSTMPDGSARGFGRVHFNDEAAAENAMAMYGTVLRGNALRIEPSQNQEGRGRAAVAPPRRGADASYGGASSSGRMRDRSSSASRAGASGRRGGGNRWIGRGR